MSGIYSNAPEGISNIDEAEDLRKLLFKPFYVYAWEEEKDFNGEIEIIQLSNKKIEISYFNDNKLIISKILKGKFKDGFFVVKRKIRPIGVPLIFYTYKERRIMIGLDEDDKLIIKTGKYDVGMIFIFAGGGKERNKYEFKKKKPSS